MSSTKYEQIPPDFDWVSERQKCSMALFYERLLAGARRNVDTRNATLTTEERGNDFSVEDHGDGLFGVVRRGAPGLAVRFKADRTTLSVEPSPDVKGAAFSGTLTLTDKARCRLRVGDEELDEWQVLRRGLERLFFPA